MQSSHCSGSISILPIHISCFPWKNFITLGWVGPSPPEKGSSPRARFWGCRGWMDLQLGDPTVASDPPWESRNPQAPTNIRIMAVDPPLLAKLPLSQSLALEGTQEWW